MAGSGYIGMWSCSEHPRVSAARSGTRPRRADVAFECFRFGKNTDADENLPRVHTHAPRSLIIKWLINFAAWITVGWSRPGMMKEAMSSPRASLKRD